MILWLIYLVFVNYGKIQSSKVEKIFLENCPDFFYKARKNFST